MVAFLSVLKGRVLVKGKLACDVTGELAYYQNMPPSKRWEGRHFLEQYETLYYIIPVEAMNLV